jgi:S-adenosylmethionine:tRNA ribosyltransferase-isomerase
MVVDRKTGTISHHKFYEIENFLNPYDVLVLNKTKVFPARLYTEKVTGGKVELLFLEEIKPGIWSTLTHPGVKPGVNLALGKHLFNVIDQVGMTATVDTHLGKTGMLNILRRYGKTPLPPYINSGEKEQELRKEYQTVYAKSVGSVAAPTAGFHFTNRLLKKIEAKGVRIEYITLHVGLGTFIPIKSKNIEDHPMHFEYFELDKDTAMRLNQAKKSGRRIISVGTTSVRVLETCAKKKGGAYQLVPQKKSTNIFIYPPYKFKFTDALITNFHLPKSTLLALVSAFVSNPNTEKVFKNFKNSIIGKAYQEAIKEKYRFYSFGDSSLII